MQLRSLGWRNGARIVARAWVDPDFKQRLLTEGRETVRELDIPPGKLGLLGIAENTPDVHNVLVCTLCSCYPWPTLGLQPVWYKSVPYRSRVVADPRGVLREFGTELAAETEVRVWDSTSEVRFMVLPERPAGTEGMSEEDLAALVTRDSMIGVTKLTVQG